MAIYPKYLYPPAVCELCGHEGCASYNNAMRQWRGDKKLFGKGLVLACVNTVACERRQKEQQDGKEKT